MTFMARPSRATKAAPVPSVGPVDPGAVLAYSSEDERQLKATLIASFAAMRPAARQVVLDALRADYDPTAARRAIDGADFTGELASVVRALAALAERGFKDSVGMVPVRAVEWAQQFAADRVVDIDRSTREGIKQVVVDGLIRGRGVEPIAADVRQMVGLTQQWSIAVARYRERLLATGTPARTAGTLADAYRDRLLDRRADAIARTESITATSQGRLQGYRDMQTTGGLSLHVEKEWLTAPEVSKRGRRVCPLCKPLNHQRVEGLHGLFRSGDLVAETSPLHVACRCSVIVHDLGISQAGTTN